MSLKQAAQLMSALERPHFWKCGDLQKCAVSSFPSHAIADTRSRTEASRTHTSAQVSWTRAPAEASQTNTVRHHGWTPGAASQTHFHQSIIDTRSCRSLLDAHTRRSITDTHYHTLEPRQRRAWLLRRAAHHLNDESCVCGT